MIGAALFLNRSARSAVREKRVLGRYLFQYSTFRTMGVSPHKMPESRNMGSWRGGGGYRDRPKFCGGRPPDVIDRVRFFFLTQRSNPFFNAAKKLILSNFRKSELSTSDGIRFITRPRKRRERTFGLATNSVPCRSPRHKPVRRPPTKCRASGTKLFCASPRNCRALGTNSANDYSRPSGNQRVRRRNELFAPSATNSCDVAACARSANELLCPSPTTFRASGTNCALSRLGTNCAPFAKNCRALAGLSLRRRQQTCRAIATNSVARRHNFRPRATNLCAPPCNDSSRPPARTLCAVAGLRPSPTEFLLPPSRQTLLRLGNEPCGRRQRTVAPRHESLRRRTHSAPVRNESVPRLHTNVRHRQRTLCAVRTNSVRRRTIARHMPVNRDWAALGVSRLFGRMRGHRWQGRQPG